VADLALTRCDAIGQQSVATLGNRPLPNCERGAFTIVPRAGVGRATLVAAARVRPQAIGQQVADQLRNRRLHNFADRAWPTPTDGVAPRPHATHQPLTSCDAIGPQLVDRLRTSLVRNRTCGLGSPAQADLRTALHVCHNLWHTWPPTTSARFRPQRGPNRARQLVRTSVCPVGVSEYKLVRDLPPDLVDVLPSAEDIRSRIVNSTAARTESGTRDPRDREGDDRG